MQSFALDVESYSKQNSNKIIKKILFYISLVAIIFFSVYFIIILDTDWHRIGSGGGILEQLSYFVGLDFSIMKHLIVPTFETFLMACLGTMLGLFFSLPVAWLGARNVTPLGMASFGFARFLMTISRSVHEIIWALKNKLISGYGADVIEKEFIDIKKSPIIKNINKYNIIVTPHIGGMTYQGQLRAYNYAVGKFKKK